MTEADQRPRAARGRLRPVPEPDRQPPHTLVEAVPTVANAAHYAQLVAEAARRRRVIDLGIQLAHSDADPAVLAHLAGELADTRTATPGERRWEDRKSVV